MKKWSLLLVVGFAMVGLNIGAVFGSNSPPSSYSSNAIITVANGAGTQYDGIVPVNMNTLNLVNGSFINSDASDILHTDQNSIEVPGFGQSIDQNAIPWFWDTAVPANASKNLVVYMFGDPADHPMPLQAGNDRIDVAYDATLDIQDEITVEAEFLLSDLTGTKVLVEKPNSYKLYVDNGVLKGEVNSTGAPIQNTQQLYADSIWGYRWCDYSNGITWVRSKFLPEITAEDDYGIWNGSSATGYANINYQGNSQYGCEVTIGFEPFDDSGLHPSYAIKTVNIATGVDLSWAADAVAWGQPHSRSWILNTSGYPDYATLASGGYDIGQTYLPATGGYLNNTNNSCFDHQGSYWWSPVVTPLSSWATFPYWGGSNFQPADGIIQSGWDYNTIDNHSGRHTMNQYNSRSFGCQNSAEVTARGYPDPAIDQLWDKADVDDQLYTIDFWPYSSNIKVDYVRLEVMYEEPGVAQVIATGATNLAIDNEYHAKMTFDGTDVNVYLDGVQDGTAVHPTAPDVANSNTNDLVLGSTLDGYIDAVKIGSTDLSTPNWQLDIDFEAKNNTSNQVGNIGNAWEYTGQVNDISGNANHGVYHLTADHSNLTVSMGGLLVQDDIPPSAGAQSISNQVGTVPIGEFLTPQPSDVGRASPLTAGLFMASESSGMPPNAWWLLLGTIIATFAGSRLMKIVPSFTVTAVAGGAVLGMIVLIGGLSLWFIVFYALWSMGTIAIHQYWRGA